MMIQFQNTPYGAVVLYALIAAALVTVVLAIRMNGRRLNTALWGRSYFWGYLVGLHLALHYGVLTTAYLVYGGAGEDSPWYAGLFVAAHVITGVGLIGRIREAWIAAALLFMSGWLSPRELMIDVASAVFLLCNFYYARRRWAEFGTLWRAPAVNPPESVAR
jgi:hypothetical protein